jgi:hypothetical protein
VRLLLLLLLLQDNVLRNGALPKAVAPVDEDRVAIGYSNGSIAVVETYDVRVVPGGPAFGTTVFELKEEHLMKKLWSGLMPTLGTKYARTHTFSGARTCAVFTKCDNVDLLLDLRPRRS